MLDRTDSPTFYDPDFGRTHGPNFITFDEWVCNLPTERLALFVTEDSTEAQVGDAALGLINSDIDAGALFGDHLYRVAHAVYDSLCERQSSEVLCD